MREGVRDLSALKMDLTTTEKKLKWANEIAIGLISWPTSAYYAVKLSQP